MGITPEPTMAIGIPMPIDLLALGNNLGLAGGWIIVLVLIAWILFMPEKVDKVRVVVLGALTWIGARVRRKYHSAAIRTALNPQIGLLREQLGIPDELPELEIRYVSANQEDRPIFENGRVVVFLRDATASRAENVVRTAMHYVSASVYPQTRPFMNRPTNLALDLALTRRLLFGEKDALRHYTRYFVEDVCSVDKELNHLYGQLASIDERGLLPGVLLHQLSALAIRLGPAYHHSEAVQKEVVGFVRFIESIANRTKDELQLDYNVRYIKVSVVLLGRDETLSKYGFTPYSKHVARALMSGFNGVYILAAGRKTKLVSQFLRTLDENEYFGKRITEFELDERTLTQAGRTSDRAIGYISFRPRRTAS